MMTEDSDIQFAKGLAQAHKRRTAMVDQAIILFEEATSPEQRAAAARLLIGTSEQADVEVNQHMATVTGRIQAERRGLVALAGAMKANR